MGAAITGMGVVSPAGSTPDTLFETLLAGRSRAELLTGDEFARHPVRIACRVPELPGDVLSAKEARRMDPFARFGVTAAVRALADAGTPVTDPGRAAVVVGNAVGGRVTSDAESLNYAERGPKGVNPLMPLLTMPNAAAALISMRLGWHGPATTIATTCASSADAIGQAMLLLETGRADVVLAGGCEAIISPVTMAAFASLGAVSARNDDPARASRPFDAGRDGFVMGEGAAFVVLERLADARARGARVHGVVAGYGATADAHHLSAPPEDGAGAVAAMTAALADAGLQPADIAHVNAHGTSTPHNDRVEAAALRKVFGGGAVPVTSTKGVTGHLIGAAGALELLATTLAVREGVVPPTANHERTEPGMDLDVVHGAPRAIASGPALSNSFGFGGHNACLVVIPA
ncbi:beta-ketoacyl-[acyl-carrier-protein] synthase family protein [Spirilliplanes yamanashiensis]|uniref:3-oxoacyl-[acyl-carrier-protein] synthase 2 n=1 Tax=Spirilliplanes yamanashiensis TaxID=42233 RepID=A0A8J3Y5F2_9ACTN|nr:beta-ketoacyl-[acyl-carrier-protein] synthase family protein [Spirilliplanes yamanashiensis]MDP9819312.1 3-oxoacyl-[acyl-carrier-protein] synthase II [Spirilliplanes yamanashiensis]GIJ01865.1 3-oxoacyl-[acyl-carrier-protein] synthase 2 [Spirilliplanes yamanashiensis]